MKRLYFNLALVFVLALVMPGYAGKGNKAPSGPHYNLNVIGVPKDKSADMTNNNGHRIFVKLQGKTKIMLSEGDEYRVLDANGTDGPAKFQLPNPDPNNDGITEYSVWTRALGTPGGAATMTSCMYDIDGEYCTSYSLILVRDTKKKNYFMNVTNELLYVYVDLNEDGTPERYPLFSNDLYGYLWDYDNRGLKLAQFRFYQIPTDVNNQQ